MAMQLTARTPAQSRDAGFTLVEALITIAILAVITVPLANAIITILRNTDATSNRMALSHDAQISAAYFARDVAAVGVHDYTANGAPFVASIQLNAAYNAGGKTCGTAATPTAMVRFLSDDWDTSGATPAVSTDIVAYYLTPAVANVSELHRLRCAGSTTTEAVLAHYVYNGPVPADPADKRRPPALTCFSSSICDATTPPLQVALTLWDTKASADPYQISLTGQRRQS